MPNQATQPVAPANGYEQTKQLIEQTGRTGLLSPLMIVLNKLLEDPVLKKTMEGMPVQDTTQQKSDKSN